jgi:hypothetical protein
MMVSACCGVLAPNRPDSAQAFAIVMMRSLLRSLEKTPKNEHQAHRELYSKLNAEAVRLMPRKRRDRLRRQLGRMFTFVWKKFSGSYFFLSSRSRG